MEFFRIGVLNAHPDVTAHAFVGHKVQRIEVNPASGGVLPGLTPVVACQSHRAFRPGVQ
jgi:hypothetical protein